MMGARELHAVGEEFEHATTGQNLLDALVEEQFSAGALAVGQQRVAPLVVGLVGVEVMRNDHTADAAGLAHLVDRLDRHLALQVMLSADGRAIVEVVATVGEEPALDDVVSVYRRRAAEDTAMVVAFEDAFAEGVACEQWRIHDALRDCVQELAVGEGVEPSCRLSPTISLAGSAL